MLLNLMLIIIILATAGVAIFLFFRKRTDDTDDEVVVDTFTLEYLTEAIIQVFNRILKLNVNDLNLNRRETEKAEQNKSNLRKALKTCCYGDIGKKEYVKDYIMDILQAQLGVTEEHIDHVIAFDNPNAVIAAGANPLTMFSAVSGAGGGGGAGGYGAGGGEGGHGIKDDDTVYEYYNPDTDETAYLTNLDALSEIQKHFCTEISGIESKKAGDGAPTGGMVYLYCY